jgi:hypothetical protein
MKQNYVYVVYLVEENDLVDVNVFVKYNEARRFVETAKEKGEGKYKVWQRPIEGYEE